MPWSPMVPETMTASPGRALPPQMSTPAGTTPMPAVLMNSRRRAPLDHLGVAGDDRHARLARPPRAIEATIRSRSATGSPSSRMKPADRYSGAAPTHGQVVDRAVDGQRADVAAGKKRGLTT